MTLTALADQVILQRSERLTDGGPPLRGIGSARFQIHNNLLIVGHAMPRSGKEAELIDRVQRFARERWLTVSWTILHGRDPAGLEAALLRQQFHVHERLRLMGHAGPLAETPPPAGVRVSPVSRFGEMELYERVSVWGFNDNPTPPREQIAARSRDRWDEQEARWYQYYLGWLNDQPVSGAYVSLWERVPTIYGVATIPPARRSGIAAQVMIRLVRDTLARGFPWTCLYVAVGNPAQLLYEKLGYATLYEQTTYQWGLSR